MTQCQDLTQPTHPKPPFTKPFQSPELQYPCLSLIQHHWISWWREASCPQVAGQSLLPCSRSNACSKILGTSLCSWQNSPNLDPGSLPILTTFCCQLGTLIKYVTETITSYCFTWFRKPSVVNTFLLRSPSSSSAEVWGEAMPTPSLKGTHRVCLSKCAEYWENERKKCRTTAGAAETV